MGKVCENRCAGATSGRKSGTKAEELLRRLNPGRYEFSEGELRIVREALGEDVEAAGRFNRLPWVFVPIGGRIRVRGREYECVKADSVLLPSQACSGCDLRKGRCQCVKYQCSPFDRIDGKFTWFREVKDGE